MRLKLANFISLSRAKLTKALLLLDSLAALAATAVNNYYWD